MINSHTLDTIKMKEAKRRITMDYKTKAIQIALSLKSIYIIMKQ